MSLLSKIFDAGKKFAKWSASTFIKTNVIRMKASLAVLGVAGAAKLATSGNDTTPILSNSPAIVDQGQSTFTEPAPEPVILDSNTITYLLLGLAFILFLVSIFKKH